MKNTISHRISIVLAATGLLALTVLIGCQRADSSTPAPNVADAEAVVVEPGSYSFDPAHSEIGFQVKHLGISTVRGIFNEADASITFADDKLSSLNVEATVQTASVFTNEADRDNHLRSADFFDAENHPEITFESTDVSNVSGERFTLKGDLTIRGITKPVSLDAEYLGTAVDPWGNQRAAFTAEGTINRKDFGLNWNKALEAGGFLVGDDVTIVLDVQAVKQAQ